jgi:hypothetical protein
VADAYARRSLASQIEPEATVEKPPQITGQEGGQAKGTSTGAPRGLKIGIARLQKVRGL